MLVVTLLFSLVLHVFYTISGTPYYFISFKWIMCVILFLLITAGFSLNNYNSTVIIDILVHTLSVQLHNSLHLNFSEKKKKKNRRLPAFYFFFFFFFFFFALCFQRIPTLKKNVIAAICMEAAKRRNELWYTIDIIIFLERRNIVKVECHLKLLEGSEGHYMFYYSPRSKSNCACYFLLLFFFFFPVDRHFGLFDANSLKQ